MRLIDEAKQAVIKVAVCSAATRSSVNHVVKSLLGDEPFEVAKQFCCVLAYQRLLSQMLSAVTQQYQGVRGLDGRQDCCRLLLGYMCQELYAQATA